MTIEEKKAKLQELFNQQKEILANVTILNFMDSALKIRQLELQKEIIKATPLPRYKEGVIQNKTYISLPTEQKEIIDKSIDTFSSKGSGNYPRAVDFEKHSVGHFDINLKRR